MNSMKLKDVTHDELKKAFEKFYTLEYGQFEEAVNYLLRNKDFLDGAEFIRMTGDKTSVTIDTIGVSVPDHYFNIEMNEVSIIKLGSLLKLKMNKF